MQTPHRCDTHVTRGISRGLNICKYMQIIHCILPEEELTSAPGFTFYEFLNMQNHKLYVKKPISTCFNGQASCPLVVVNL